jgi:general secretion pathway protein K
MRPQRGVALVTALLVVAHATTAAVAMVVSQQVAIRRAGNVLDAEQAYLYLAGLEAWAGQVLRRDRRDGDTDHLGEDWATLLPPIPVDGGQLAGRLEDAQARLNLNNLVGADGAQVAIEMQRLRRLLVVLGLDGALASAVADWLDPDLEPGGMLGAEDDVYLGRTPPYRAANRPMASASELRLVAGFMEAVAEDGRTAYDVVAPFVTALPQRTAVNVNTAAAPVLAALADGLTLADGEALVAARGEEGYESVQAFLQQDALAGRAVPEEGLAVASSYFLADADAVVGRAAVRMRSTLWRRPDGTCSTVRRSQGND